MINYLREGKFVWISLFFLFSPLLISAFVIEPTGAPQFLIASFFLFTALIFCLIKRREWPLPPPFLLIVLILFYGLQLTSISRSFNTADAIFESQKFFLGIAALVFFLVYFNSDIREQNLFKSMVIICLACTLFSLFELRQFELSRLSEQGVYFSLTGHKNLVSSLVFLLLPFSVSGIFQWSGTWRLVSIFSTLLCVLTIALLQTRSVYLALGVSVLIFAILFFTTSWKKRNRIFLFSGVFLSGILAVFFVFKQSAEPATSSSNASLHERYQLWSNTFKLVEEEPFWGVGIGNWQYNYSKFSVEKIESALHYNTVFKNPHNDFLSVLSETGLVGFLLLIIIIGVLTKNAIKKLLHERNINLTLIFATLTGLMTDAFFSFPKDRVAHIVMAALLVALVIKWSGSLKSAKRSGFVMGVFLVIGLSVNGLIGWKRISGEFYTLKVLEAQAHKNPRAVIDNGYKAMSVFYQTDPTCTPIYSYIGWGYEAFGNMDSLLFVNEAAYALSPFDYKVLSNYGYVLERRHQFNTAEKVLMEALRIHPTYEATLVNLSVLEYNRGNYPASLEWLKRIPNYEKNYSGNLQRIREKME